MAFDRPPPPEPVRTPGKHVFISYSRSDLAYVRRLAVHLERAGIRTWYDYKIETGQRFSQAIQTAIDDCFAFVIVLSKASSQSDWVDKEIDRAAHRKKPIIPLLLEKGAVTQHIEVSPLNWDDVTKGGMPEGKTIDRLRRLSQPPDPLQSQILTLLSGPPAITVVATAALKETGARLTRRWRSIAIAVALGAAATSYLLATNTEMAGTAFAPTTLAGGVISGVVCIAVDRRRTTPTDPFRRDPAATPRVPPMQSHFRGRKAELDTWCRVHSRARDARQTEEAHALGPVILAIHGAAGTGKSALGHALANNLRGLYPDGYFMVAFGASGATRSPADISRDLLLQLGWLPDDMPNETEDRVATIRSLTRAKRMLFLFDAARDHDQIRQVIPAEPQCAVIITSRREIASALGLAPQQPLGRTSLADSLDIFSAISSHEWTRGPEAVVEVVELCGRLPLAIQSAAEQLRDGTDMHRLIERLSAPTTRLEVLNYGGRAVEDRVGSEFFRLLSEQRRALAMLAHLEGDTFLPWVLRPMMSIDKGESAAIVASLAAAQLIQEADQDGPGRARYRMNPLVRLLARAQVTTSSPLIDEGEIAQARSELATAYLNVIDDVLAELDPSYPRNVGAAAPGRHPLAIRQITHSLEQHVRREYGTLLWLLTEVHRRQPVPPGMFWRCVTSLVAAVPAGTDWSTMEPIFEAAEESARLGGADQLRDGVSAAVDVLLARASYLVATERYVAAEKTVGRAEDELNSIASPPAGAILAYRLRISRIRSGAFLQAGTYRDATVHLQRATAYIEDLPSDVIAWSTVQDDLRLLRLYHAEARRLAPDDPIWSRIAPGPAADGTLVQFREALVRSEELRGRQFWHDAAGELRIEEAQRSGDARSLAVIWYRLARLHIEQVHATDEEAPATDQQPTGSGPNQAEPLRREAVRLAAECAWTFGTIGDDVGQIRARCLMVRALVLTGQLVAATQLCFQVDEQLHQLRNGDDKDQPYVRSLRARFARARGELELEYGSYQSAWNNLTFAAATFADLSDWANQDQVWRLLDKVDVDTSGSLRDALHGLRSP